jgi:hypothetical protein
VWTYIIQLCGSASNYKIEILRFSLTVVHKILDVSWYVTNVTMHNTIRIPKVKEDITTFAIKYHEKLEKHTNFLAIKFSGQHPIYTDTDFQGNNILDFSSRFTK